MDAQLHGYGDVPNIYFRHHCYIPSIYITHPLQPYTRSQMKQFSGVRLPTARLKLMGGRKCLQEQKDIWNSQLEWGMNYTLLKKDPSWCELLRLLRWRKTSKGITDMSVFFWDDEIPTSASVQREQIKLGIGSPQFNGPHLKLSKGKQLPKDREMQRQIGYWSSQFAIYRCPIKTNVKTANWFSTCAL